MVLKVGIPELVKAAKETGVAILAITNSHHMAAMSVSYTHLTLPTSDLV